MRTSIALLAALASSALAYPTDKAVSVEPRTLGLLGELLGDLTVDVTGILSSLLHHGHPVELLHRLKPEGAAALQCGAVGCKSGAIDLKSRLALKTWLLFHSKFDHSFKKTVISWCEGNDELVLSKDVMASLSVYIPALAEITAQGQLYVTVDGIFDASKLESALVLNIGAQSSLSAWIEAKAGLAMDVKSGLNVCAAGGIVSSLTADIKAALRAWINSKECDLHADLKTSVRAWLNGHAGGELVEIGTLAESALSTINVGASIGVHVEKTGGLSVGGRASLAAFLETDVSVGLGADAKQALEACAKGKLATDMELNIRTKLAVWLASSECSLGVELKAVVLLWLSFGVEADVSGSLDLVSGHLGGVSDILTNDLLSGLSGDLRGALSLCAAGGGLTGLSFDARAELAAFLGGCTSIDIEVSIQIIILQWFTGCNIPGSPSGSPSSSASSLPSSTPMPGSSSVPSGPGASASVSVPSGAAPSGPASSGPAATSTPCETDISEIVSSTVIPGPNGSGSSTVTIPVVPTATGPAETPSGVAPSGPAETGPAQTPSGVAPSGPAPSGPAATSTPCETDISEIVSSTVIPGGPDGSDSSTMTVPVVPTGGAETPSGVAPSGPAETGPAQTPSGAAPSGPAPSGPAATTPCETETSEIISSTVIPGGPDAGSSSTMTVPVVPTNGAETPSDVAPSGPAQTPSGPAPTGPAATTPCETSVSDVVSSTVIPGAPAETPSGVEPTGVPAPSGPAASGPSASTPCETSVSDVVSSTVVPGTPAPSAPAPTTPPTQPADDDEEDTTVTETVTSTIYNCV